MATEHESLKSAILDGKRTPVEGTYPKTKGLEKTRTTGVNGVGKMISSKKTVEESSNWNDTKVEHTF